MSKVMSDLKKILEKLAPMELMGWTVEMDRMERTDPVKVSITLSAIKFPSTLQGHKRMRIEGRKKPASGKASGDAARP